MSRDFLYFKPAFIMTILVFFQSLSVLARDFVFQNSETQTLTQVQILNKTREIQTVWVLFYEDEFIEEHSFDIPANSIKRLDLEGLKKPNWNFSVLTKSLSVAPVSNQNFKNLYSLSLLNTSNSGKWEWSSQTRFEMKLKNQKEVDLHFYNLYVEKQKVTLTFINSANEVLQKTHFYSASFRKKLSRSEMVPFGSSRLIVETEAPVQLLSSEIFMPVIDTQRPVEHHFKYFLVQNGRGGSTFVAPIEDLDLILKAREEILNPQGYIVFAEIELNKNQANRNFSSPEKPYWSWAIKKVTGMSQVGADWCQAYPEMIERMLHRFLRQESVCFRGQRIIRELKPDEVHSGQLNP